MWYVFGFHALVQFNSQNTLSWRTQFGSQNQHSEIKWTFFLSLGLLVYGSIVFIETILGLNDVFIRKNNAWWTRQKHFFPSKTKLDAVCSRFDTSQPQDLTVDNWRMVVDGNQVERQGIRKNTDLLTPPSWLKYEMKNFIKRRPAPSNVQIIKTLQINELCEKIFINETIIYDYGSVKELYKYLFRNHSNSSTYLSVCRLQIVWTDKILSRHQVNE